MSSTSVIAFAVFCLAACSGGDGDLAADAGPADAGALGPNCSQVESFGELGALTGQVISVAADSYLSVDQEIAAGPPRDLFVVELFGDAPPFGDGLKTGTFPIEGAQTNYNECGVCVVVFADLVEGSPTAMAYIAQSGTVTITSVEGSFAGSFEPDGDTVEMVGYARSGNGYTAAQPLCAIRGGGATWDQVIP